MTPELITQMRADSLQDIAESGAEADVIRITSGDSDLGGETQTPNVIATYPVDLQTDQTPRQDTAQGGRSVSVDRFKAYLPWNADVKPTDRLSIDGAFYDVLGTSGGDTARFSLVADVIRVT